jgi:ubiquitin-protein ligase
MALKIIEKQYTKVDECFCLSKTEDPYILEGSLIPNENSRFFHHKITFSLFFPKQYPFSPPIIIFSPPLFHPNIDFAGILSIPEFKENWSPAVTIDILLHSILSILDEPLLLEEEECKPVNSFASEIWNEIDIYNQILNEK